MARDILKSLFVYFILLFSETISSELRLLGEIFRLFFFMSNWERQGDVSYFENFPCILPFMFTTQFQCFSQNTRIRSKMLIICAFC